MSIPVYPEAPEQTAYIEMFSDSDRENVSNVTKMIWSQLTDDGTSSLFTSVEGVVPTNGFVISVNTGAPYYNVDITSGVITISELVIEVGAVSGLSLSNYFSSWSYATQTTSTEIVFVLRYLDQSSNPVEIGIQPYDNSINSWYQDHKDDSNIITLGFADYIVIAGTGIISNVRYGAEISGVRLSRSYPVPNNIIDGGTISDPDPE